MDLHEEVSPEVYFYLADGSVLKSAYELYKAIDHIDANTFKHHVNPERNDFANWIGDIYRDKKLATSLRKCKTKKSKCRTSQSLYSKS